MTVRVSGTVVSDDPHTADSDMTRRSANSHAAGPNGSARVTVSSAPPAQSAVNCAPGSDGAKEETRDCPSCHTPRPLSQYTKRPGMTRRPRRCNVCIASAGLPIADVKSTPASGP